jgi:Polyketide cyclase / dehydrase and lipid transport
MGTVRAARQCAGSVHEAETCWYETGRWSEWVHGLARVTAVEGDWPEVGSSVAWESGPAGRGHVTERVLAYEQLRGQMVEVDDDSMNGRQTVTFTPEGDDVVVELELEYRLKRRSILTPLLDALFIRRAMTSSLEVTLARFGAELRSAR